VSLSVIQKFDEIEISELGQALTYQTCSISASTSRNIIENKKPRYNCLRSEGGEPVTKEMI
jgi:hypothetical protein